MPWRDEELIYCLLIALVGAAATNSGSCGNCTSNCGPIGSYSQFYWASLIVHESKVSRTMRNCFANEMICCGNPFLFLHSEKRTLPDLLMKRKRVAASNDFSPFRIHSYTSSERERTLKGTCQWFIVLQKWRFRKWIKNQLTGSTICGWDVFTTSRTNNPELKKKRVFCFPVRVTIPDQGQ